MKLIARAIIICVVIALTACDIPRDPEDTLQQARGGTLRVGFVENTPWVIVDEGRVTGIEPTLVRALAERLDADVRWIRGAEGELLTALEHRALAMVVGGFTRSNPWRRRLAFTNSYQKMRLILALPPGDVPLVGAAGAPIGVRPGSGIAGYVRAQGATPVFTAELADFPGPIALSESEARARGFRVLPTELHTEQHVLALPPGENAWLVYVEDFLYRHRNEIDTLVKEAQTRRRQP